MLQNMFITMMASSIEFNPMAFVDNLYYMGMGMLVPYATVLAVSPYAVHSEIKPAFLPSRRA